MIAVRAELFYFNRSGGGIVLYIQYGINDSDSR